MTIFVSLILLLSRCISVDDTTQIEQHTKPCLGSAVEDSLTIQYLDLRVNSLLFSEVKKYIKEQQDSRQLFKSGFGYVTVGGIKLVRNGRPVEASALKEHVKDIEVEFTVGLSSFYPTMNMGTPLYYSFVENRLALVYDQTVKWLHQNSYSSASIRKIKELIKQTLMPVFDHDFEFRTFIGNRILLSPERRQQMSQEQILEMAASSLSKLKTVIGYVDGSISYRYIQLGKVR